MKMRVRPERPTSLPRPARRPRPRPARPATPPPPAPSAPDPLADERRARRSGGPIDRAHYGCACGYAFQADVCTTVACPHCGTQQAW